MSDEHACDMLVVGRQCCRVGVGKSVRRVPEEHASMAVEEVHESSAKYSACGFEDKSNFDWDEQQGRCGEIPFVIASELAKAFLVRRLDGLGIVEQASAAAGRVSGECAEPRCECSWCDLP